MIYMCTMACSWLMAIVVPMGQRQRRIYKGVNPVTVNGKLSRFEVLCNWYTSYKQRLHVHLENREYRRLLLGIPQTPSYRKRTSFFISVQGFCKSRCCILCAETGKQPEIQEREVSQMNRLIEIYDEVRNFIYSS